MCGLPKSLLVVPAALLSVDFVARRTFAIDAIYGCQNVDSGWFNTANWVESGVDSGGSTSVPDDFDDHRRFLAEQQPAADDLAALNLNEASSPFASVLFNGALNETVATLLLDGVM